MKIAIPTQNDKLCGHFGHCEEFTFAQVNPETKEILELTTGAPDGGVSCQCAGWLAEQGVEVILAGGIGGRPIMALNEKEIKVIAGCPELEIKEILEQYLSETLLTGENSCGSDPNHSCHSHGEGHHCHQ